MDNEPGKPQADTMNPPSTAVPSYFDSVTLAYASNLARSGQLQEAVDLLLPIVSKPEAPLSAVDLLAKIYAQQARYDEAAELWRRALSRDPANPHFQHSLERCNRAHYKGIPPYRTSLRKPIFFMSVLVIFILSIQYLNTSGLMEQIPRALAAVTKKNPPPSPTPPPVKSKPSPTAIKVEKKTTPVIPTPKTEATVSAPEIAPTLPPADTSRELVLAALQDNDFFKSIPLHLSMSQENDTVRIFGSVPTVYVRSIVEKTLRKIPEIANWDFSGLTISQLYTVLPGDTLRSISIKLYGDTKWVRAIAQANHIESPDLLYAQQKIVVPLNP